jgi:predicted regulator of Ras-like GTPase activity (Roadblock/LC7/MglB family)
MPTEKDYQDVVDQVEQDMNGFIAASVVDLESGMTLTARSTRADFDLAVASAYNSELVKQKIKIMKALGLKTILEDMLLTLGDQIHLIKMFPGGHTFLYLAADRSSTNLAIVRNSVNRHVAALH